MIHHANDDIAKRRREQARRVYAILEKLKTDIDEYGEGPDFPAAQNRIKLAQEILREIGR